MKHNYLILSLLFTAIFLITCQKDEVKITKLTTIDAIATSALTATANGKIIELSSAGHSQYGFVYSTAANPTIADSKVELGNPKVGNFTGNIAGLAPSTTYYIRSFCSEDGSYLYGEQKTFTTPDGKPVLTTTAVTAITTTTATSGGNISTDGGGSAITARGICWATTASPTIANNITTDGIGSGIWASNLAELSVNTTYYVRAYATNSEGTVYGNEINFSTLDGKPALTTTAITAITVTTATSGGNITYHGGFAITARGVCWSTTANPTIADNKTIDGIGFGNFSSNLTGLIGNTTYYVRSYATNSVGTGYGNELNYTPMPDGPGSPITDNNGNTYNTVWIGGKLWMAENLKTTKYNDGTAITNITDNTAWTTQTAGVYCWYNNDVANKATYGALYNWPTVNTAKLAPKGWHVATDYEWQTLIDYLGGRMNATTTGADNSSGFTALAGGYRSGYGGAFYDMGIYGYWWSSTVGDYGNPRGCFHRYSGDYAIRKNFNESHGFSVRCVRD